MRKNVAMRIRNVLRLCIISVAVCIFYISSANAKVCFLPGGHCDSEAGGAPAVSKHIEKGCVLGAPLPHYVCEQCENGFYKCSGCKKDYKMVRGECVCDGEDCRLKKDTYCPSESQNSCGLCATGKCACSGVKCSSTQKCDSSLNACGNCKGTCIDQNKCEQGWTENKPEGCFEKGKTPDGSKPCYKKRECTCAEDASKCTCADRGWSSNSNCANGKIAVKKDVINGSQCYLCSEKTCSFYGDNYFDNESSCTSCEKPTPVDGSKVGGLICFECPKVTACADLNLSDAKDDTCFNTNTEDAKCQSSIGHACWKNTNAKGCAERGLAEAKDAECFNTNKENKDCEKTCWENTSPKSCAERGLSMGKDDVCFKKHTEDKKCADSCWKNEDPKSCEERGAGFYSKEADCKAKCADGTCVEDKTCGENNKCFICGEKRKQPCQDVDAKTCKCGTVKNAEGCAICKTDCKCKDYDASYQAEDTCSDNCKKAKLVDADKVGGLTCYHCNDARECKDFNKNYKDSVQSCPSCSIGTRFGAPIPLGEVCGLTCVKCGCASGGGSSGGSSSSGGSGGGGSGGGNPQPDNVNMCEKCCDYQTGPNGRHIVKTTSAPSGCDGFTCGSNCCEVSGFKGTEECDGYSDIGIGSGYSDVDSLSDAHSFGDLFSSSGTSSNKGSATHCGPRNCEKDYPGQNRHCCITKQCYYTDSSHKTKECSGVEYLCVPANEPCKEFAITGTGAVSSETLND